MDTIICQRARYTHTHTSHTRIYVTEDKRWTPINWTTSLQLSSIITSALFINLKINRILSSGGCVWWIHIKMKLKTVSLEPFTGADLFMFSEYIFVLNTRCRHTHDVHNNQIYHFQRTKKKCVYLIKNHVPYIVCIVCARSKLSCARASTKTAYANLFGISLVIPAYHCISFTMHKRDAAAAVHI